MGDRDKKARKNIKQLRDNLARSKEKNKEHRDDNNIHLDSIAVDEAAAAAALSEIQEYNFDSQIADAILSDPVEPYQFAAERERDAHEEESHNVSKAIKCRLINKGKQIPVFYETPNPFGDNNSDNSKEITNLAKGQFLRGEIVRDRHSLHPTPNDGSLNFNLYSYLVSFWWISSSIISPLSIILLFFVWQYNSVKEIEMDKEKSKLLSLILPLLEIMKVPADYITIINADGSFNMELLRPLIGLIMTVITLYSVFKSETVNWSIWIFITYCLMLVSILTLILLILLPGQYWKLKEVFIGKGPLPLITIVTLYFVITSYIDAYVIQDMSKSYSI